MNLPLCYTTSLQPALRERGRGWENPLFAKRVKVDLTGWKYGSSGYVLLAETGMQSAHKKNTNKIIWPVTQRHLEFFTELFVFAALAAWSLLSNHKKILANMLLLWFLFRVRLPPLSRRISVGINITNRSRTLTLEHYSIFPKSLSSLFSIHKSLLLLPGIFPASLRPHLNVSNLHMIGELFKWYAKI